MEQKFEFPFYKVEDTWERRHTEKYGTVRVIPVDIQVKLIEECPEVDPKWDFFATDYQTSKLSDETVTEMHQKLFLRYCNAIRYIDWINCIVRQPDFNIDDKWKIIGWLFSLCLDEIPSC